MAYAKEANTEAAKFLLLKGAIWYFAQAKEDAKAVAAIAALGTQMKELPPEVLCNDILKPAIDHVSEQNMPGFFAQFRAASAQMEIAKLGPSVRRGKADEPTRRRYAELLAVAGDWKGALDVFAKLDAAKDAVKAESAGKTLAQAGDFWWDYQTIEPTAAHAITTHAVDLYRKAIASGELTGLKKAVVEKRIASVSSADSFNVSNVVIVSQGSGTPAASVAPQGSGASAASAAADAVLQTAKKLGFDFPKKRPAGHQDELFYPLTKRLPGLTCVRTQYVDDGLALIEFTSLKYDAKTKAMTKELDQQYYPYPYARLEVGTVSFVE